MLCVLIKTHKGTSNVSYLVNLEKDCHLPTGKKNSCPGPHVHVYYIFMIRFSIDVQVQGHHLHQCAPFKVTG